MKAAVSSLALELARLRRRRREWTPWLALVVVVVTLLALSPGTSGGFTSTVTNSTDEAATRASFARTTNELPYRSSFATGATDWTTYNGCWSVASENGYGVYSDTCRSTTAGDKAVTGRATWTDYTVQADVRIDAGQQAGLLARVSNPSAGLDNLTAYYAYITTTGKLELGRMVNGTYTFLATTDITGGTASATWYHLVVQVAGCTLTLAQSTVGAAASTSLTYVDTGCTPTAGMIGLRDFDATASWRYVTATEGAATSTTPTSFNNPWSTGSAPGFTTYGGTWAADPTAGTYSNSTTGRGNKAVETTKTWGDVSVTGEVRFNTSSASNLDAGFNVRVADAGVGTDQLNGYYGGITRTSLLVGRHDLGSYQDFARTPLPDAVIENTWQHLTVEAVGCRITVTAQASTGGPQTTLSITDAGCRRTGYVGVRTQGIPTSFRSLAVTPR